MPAEATAIDLAAQKVTATTGVYDYDYLVIATGYRNNFGGGARAGPGWQRPHDHHSGRRHSRRGGLAAVPR